MKNATATPTTKKPPTTEPTIAKLPAEGAGLYAAWEREQEREIETSVKSIKYESDIKAEITRIEEKLKLDSEIHFHLSKSVKHLGLSMLKQKTRLRKLKAWNGDESRRPKLLPKRHVPAAKYEMMELASSLVVSLLQSGIKRDRNEE